MTHRVGAKGQVVIPKELRDALGIEPGDQVAFWLEADQLVMRPLRSERALLGRFSGSDLVGPLKAARAADREREARR